jgi:hypothetical protein
MLARGDAQAASDLLNKWGHPWGLSPRAEEERKKMESEVAAARRGKG